MNRVLSVSAVTVTAALVAGAACSTPLKYSPVDAGSASKDSVIGDAVGTGASGGRDGTGGRSAVDLGSASSPTTDAAAGSGGVIAILTGSSGGSGGGAVGGGTSVGGADGPVGPMGCVTGLTRLCKDDPNLALLGNCGGGVETCAGGKWGACSVQPAAKDSCALLGDDASCNGKPNEGCPCVDGDTQPCGPPADIGTCRRGTQTCTGGSWGACTGAVYAAARDCTSTADNNCDGVADNTIDLVCTCASAATRPCDQHPAADGTGRCKAGSQICVVAADKKTSTWGACSGSVGPAAKDTCETGNDDNCNGVPNEGCSCVTGATQACGPAANVGICKRGTQTCTAGSWGACVGAVMPAARDCTSTADNDCDAFPDNTSDAICACKSGATQACGQHLGQDGKGLCKAGSQICVIAADKKTSAWGACTGTVGPAPADTCDPMNDNNCNGVPNEGCACVNGTTRGCGPASLGICKAGSQTCASSAWGVCVGASNAQARDCTSTKDNDCNGIPDNMDSTCACPANTTMPCAGNNTAPCSAGIKTCVLSADKTSTSWGTTCSGVIGPKTRDCTSTLDNDCNGTVDNKDSSCACTANTTMPCAGNNTPPCSAGNKTCVLSADKATTSWSTTCSGVIAPKARDCTSTLDNDCNGTLDNLDSTCMCAAGTHKCPTTTTCWSDSDTQHCGSMCMSCQSLPNTTAACTVGSCTNTCLGAVLSCAGSNGILSCGSWNFESKMPEGWFDGLQGDPADAISGSIGTSTRQHAPGTPAGSSTLVVGYAGDGVTKTQIRVRVHLCPGVQPTSINNIIRAQVFLERTSGTPGGVRGYVAAYNGATTVLAGDDFTLPEGGVWATIDTNMRSAVITDLEYVILGSTSSMTANFYFDNIQIL